MKKALIGYWKYIIIGLISGAIGSVIVICVWFVDNDLGSLADWLSAIGTIGAVWLSLYLSLRKEKSTVELYQIVLKDNILKSGLKVPGREDYQFASQIHALNPDSRNYILTLQGINLFVKNRKFERFHIELFDDESIVDSKKYMVSAGSDVRLFTFDWANIFLTYDQHRDDERWRGLKGVLNENVQVRMTFLMNTGEKIQLAVVPPENKTISKRD